jgi:hypothetical protein
MDLSTVPFAPWGLSPEAPLKPSASNSRLFPAPQQASSGLCPPSPQRIQNLRLSGGGSALVQRMNSAPLSRQMPREVLHGALLWNCNNASTALQTGTNGGSDTQAPLVKRPAKVQGIVTSAAVPVDATVAPVRERVAGGSSSVAVSNSARLRNGVSVSPSTGSGSLLATVGGEVGDCFNACCTSEAQAVPSNGRGSAPG